jgi:hypothetical protein
MRGVAVTDQVQVEPFGRAAIDSSQKLESFLVTMPLHALAEDLAGRAIERGKQGRYAIALVVVVMVSAGSFFMGKPGWVRSRAKIWGFSSS